MARGLTKPVNVFRLGDLGEPSSVFNLRLWFAVLSFGLLGAARGIDEGLISGAFNTRTFRHGIHYDSFSVSERADIKANVSAMVQIGSVAGALIAFILCDWIGRIRATQLLCLVWAAGIAIFMDGGSHGSLSAIYAGRFIAGLGIGQTPVVGPIYIAEIAPATVRGLCTCMFTGAVYLGIVLAYFANYGCQIHLSPENQAQWLVPTGLHIIMAGLILLLSLFQSESPRFLMKQGQAESAARVLARVRNQPPDGEYVARELASIQSALDQEFEASQGLGFTGRLKELLLNRRNLYKLYLASAAQLLSQWSGAGSITIYAVDLFRLLGITGSSESLLVTAIFGVVKFACAMACALFLVDYMGRKRSLLLGILLQTISMVYIAAFLTTSPQIGSSEGYALPDSKRSASRGAIAMLYISGAGWALGWNSMQYLLTAELFPLRVRALATSLAMTLHFANQYGSSRAVPNMLLRVSDGGITPSGTFWCFGAITMLGGLWVWTFVPETGGRSLESMDRLFELPWYRIGLYGNRDAEEKEGFAVDSTGMEKRGVLESDARAISEA